jgi:aconitate hydratase
MAPASFESAGRSYRFTDLGGFAGPSLSRLPLVHRILLENVLRTAPEIEPATLPSWILGEAGFAEIPFRPGRVMMHDTTCGPALVDIAAARSALAEAGADPTRLNPVLQVDVSTDHSVSVDHFGFRDALRRNMEGEILRNRERYRFMKWASRSLANLTVHPPGTGIMHTINLERLATVVTGATIGEALWAIPDTLIGTDSHTPMVNGLGVLGWGVGGLEAESVMFGLPVRMRIPAVVGVRLSGQLPAGTFATDLALLVTSRLRRADVAGDFVEFFGPGLATLSAGERSVVANMAPEYGAATGFFPVDGRVLDYLAQTGRSHEQIRLVEDYCRLQGLWFEPEATPVYDRLVEIDLGSVVASIAGPGRPQDLLPASGTRQALATRLPSGARAASELPAAPVAIAAITSCTNTSDPRLLVAAGLVARKARGFGLSARPWVKTSLTPGSPVARAYLERCGLLEDLEALGFAIAGYGCGVCIGNSGALTPMIEEAIAQESTLPIAILSGNRNFPGRVHGEIECAFLASPPLVIAWAIAGDAAVDITREPVGAASDGRPVLLEELWPTEAEIEAALAAALRPGDYDVEHQAVTRNPAWAEIAAPTTGLYPWDEGSTYLRRPPFASLEVATRLGNFSAHPLIVLGDDITTDHISPAGQIPQGSDAALHLLARGERPDCLNAYSARRGNWEVMVRGLFTNRGVRNLIRPGIAPGRTVHAGTGSEASLGEIAELYRREAISVVIVAGERYGTGSSRDWAAKGVALLGVRAVLAVGFERIHRANLVNMGVLPLLLPPEAHPHRLGLAAADRLEISADPVLLRPRGEVRVTLRREARSDTLTAIAAVETEAELDILRRGGMIPTLLDHILSEPARRGDSLPTG